MLTVQISDADLDSLAVLLDCLETTPILTSREASALYQQHWQRVIPTMLEHGASYGEASGGALSFLNGPDPRGYIRSINDDLGANVGIVSNSFRDYLSTGEVPAPHYAWRICIILKRGKKHDLELRFLRGWARQFGGRGIGMTYEKLTARLEKLELISIGAPEIAL
jgi:hypothetical protein